MASDLSFSLYLKAKIVGTHLEDVAKQLRWLLGAVQRRKHPELWELYLEERNLPLVLNKLLSKDSCCVDVGSHIGSFLNLLVRYAPKGQHIAFEPSETKSAWLRSRFSGTKVFPCAVSDKSGTALFLEEYARPGYSRLEGSVREDATNVTRYEVKTCRLDDVLLDMERVDLIKLDIEGGELAALRGAAGIIRKFRPAIIFECGSEYTMEAQKVSRRDLYEFINNELGYNIFCFGDFLFEKGPMTFDEFRKCGLYPFRAFNFVALSRN